MQGIDPEIDELMVLLAVEFKREFTAGEAAEIAERVMSFVEAVHRCGGVEPDGEDPSL